MLRKTTLTPMMLLIAFALPSRAEAQIDPFPEPGPPPPSWAPSPPPSNGPPAPQAQPAPNSAPASDEARRFGDQGQNVISGSFSASFGRLGYSDSASVPIGG